MSLFLRLFLSLWAPVVLYMALIFALSAQSQPPMPTGVSSATGHVVGYAGLAVVILRALAGGLPARITPKAALGAVAIAVAYGITDELHQMLVPGRTSELIDVAADAMGALLGIGASWAWGILSIRSDV